MGHPAAAAALESPEPSSPTPVEPGSFRHTVLGAAKRFKSTWVELGRLLVRVRDEGMFEAWGYATFEAYCIKELHIRRQTALKLTRSYSFLDRHEPREMKNTEEITTRAPAFEVVEVLADAEERGQLNAEEYQSIRNTIWNPDKAPAELRREFTERFPRPAPEPVGDAVQLRRLAQAARRLASDLKACRRISAAVAERAAALAEDVEELSSGA